MTRYKGMTSLAGLITVSCNLFAVDHCTAIILLIALVSALELVKSWLQLTAGVKCQICVPPRPLCDRSQAVCHPVQEVCEPNCNR